MKKSIVIDREYGSGGREIAKILSEKLKTEFYDGNLLELAGERFGIDLGTMKDYDEKGTGSFLHDIALLTDSFTGGNNHTVPFKVHDALSRIIKPLAKNKPCIFLGRGADEILENEVPFIHVFIYASNTQDKIDRSVKVDGISPDKAAAYIRRKDLQRKNYRKIFSKGNWDSMQSYDLCIDTSAVGYENAANAIVAAMGE
ncbi:MAG: cytidylate kinase-like family protein [Clostridiales bacterium]|nr:cytidylate kinase-like family protein [Clostridiales bacterium]